MGNALLFTAGQPFFATHCRLPQNFRWWEKVVLKVCCLYSWNGKRNRLNHCVTKSERPCKFYFTNVAYVFGQK